MPGVPLWAWGAGNVCYPSLIIRVRLALTIRQAVQIQHGSGGKGKWEREGGGGGGESVVEEVDLTNTHQPCCCTTCQADEGRHDVRPTVCVIQYLLSNECFLTGQTMRLNPVIWLRASRRTDNVLSLAMKPLRNQSNWQAENCTLFMRVVGALRYKSQN